MQYVISTEAAHKRYINQSRSFSLTFSLILSLTRKARHLDRSRAVLSRGAVERPLYFVFALATFVFGNCSF